MSENCDLYILQLVHQIKSSGEEYGFANIDSCEDRVIELVKEKMEIEYYQSSDNILAQFKKVRFWRRAELVYDPRRHILGWQWFPWQTPFPDISRTFRKLLGLRYLRNFEFEHFKARVRLEKIE